MRITKAVVLGATLLVLSTSAARADVELGASLSAAQEVPTPTGTSSGTGGMATFTYTDSDGMLTYTVSVHDMTADPIAGHLHLGPPGVAGPIQIPLPTLPKN